MTWPLFLMVLALVLLCLAAAKTPEPIRLSFGWTGLALWLFVELMYRGKFLA